MRKNFTTPAFAVVVIALALALAACGDKATDDTTTTGKTGGDKTGGDNAAQVAPAAPAISGGSWIGDAPYMERGVMAVAFFKPG